MLFLLQHITIGEVDVKRPVVKDDVMHMKNYAVENEVLREYLRHFCTDRYVKSFFVMSSIEVNNSCSHTDTLKPI